MIQKVFITDNEKKNVYNVNEVVLSHPTTSFNDYSITSFSHHNVYICAVHKDTHPLVVIYYLKNLAMHYSESFFKNFRFFESQTFNGLLPFQEPKYQIESKNEILVDIVEYMNVILDAKGDIVRNEIKGNVILNSAIDLKEKLKLVLNKPIKGVKGLKFNTLKQYESDTTIEMEICNKDVLYYRVVDPIKPPIKISKDKDIYTIECQLNNISNLFITIPVPLGTYKADINTNIGNALFDSEKSVVVWKIEKINKSKAKCVLYYESLDKEPDNRCIAVSFEAPCFSSSGMTIKEIRSDKKLEVWAKYMLKTRKYEIRI